jgi:hypothetical protein
MTMMIQTEITRDEAIRALLTHEKYADITLKGTDGSLVRANRAMLAARSPVFDSMLYGDFVEAQQSIVNVGYTEETLRDVVNYIYTDELPIVDREQPNIDNTAQDTSATRKMLALMDGATYFALPDLCRKAEAMAITQMDKKPSLCVTYFAACETHGALVATEVKDHALEKIRANPKILLEEGVSLASLSSSHFEKVLKDKNVRADELTLFQILQAWTAANDGQHDKDSAVSNETSSQSRKRAASQLTQHIALELIDPEALSTTVKASGLVTKDQLLEAYESQALLSKQQHGTSFKKMRFAGWKTTNDVVFTSYKSRGYSTEVIQCPPLTSGVHKWSILVEEMIYHVYFGVASTVHELDYNRFLGHQSGGWAYGQGSAYHNDATVSNGHPKLKTGSKVTLILDLTGEGTLSASVDGKPAVQLFAEMLSELDGFKNTKGFVPAVSISGKGGARFLGFE